MADRLIFRVWVDGELRAKEECTTLDQVDEMRTRHAAITAEADSAGSVWLIEIEDPSMPKHERYLRFGSDADGMVEPIVGLDPSDAMVLGHPFFNDE